MSRTLLSFATAEYEVPRARLNKSGRRWFDRFVSLTPTDLDDEFRRKRADLLNYRRGLYFWSWKSWCILRELEKLGSGDELFYADSQCVFESDPTPLFAVVRRHDGIGIFHQKREGHKNSTWTHGDCFRLMGCDGPKYRNGDNLAATYSAWTRTDKSLALVREWSEWSSQLAVVGDAPDAAGNSPDFQDHRQDQSILSLLAIRDGIFTLCACSQFGDGYRCGECRYPRILRVDRIVIAPPWLARPTMSSILEVQTTG